MSHVFDFSEISAEDAALSVGGNRFDVAGGSVLYAATEPEGAFAETLASFRPTARMRALPQERNLMSAGAIPAEWRDRRRLARFSLAEPLPFLDVDKPETHTFLTAQMAPQLEALGVENLDVAAMRSGNRLLTRAIAQWAWAQFDEGDGFLWSGLRYESRLGDYECWAIFAGTSLVSKRSSAIERNNGALQRVARQFDLSVH